MVSRTICPWKITFAPGHNDVTLKKVKDDVRKQKIELPESESDSVITWENLLLPWIKLISKSQIEVTFTTEKKPIFKQKLDRTDLNIEGPDLQTNGLGPGHSDGA